MTRLPCAEGDYAVGSHQGSEDDWKQVRLFLNKAFGELSFRR